jgi:radical SAM protein with 4Fe4S-binding SPASM domain
VFDTDFPPLPSELQVEVTGACNLRCRMCLVRYRPPINRIEGSMTLETFIRLLDEMPSLARVTLQGLGEPLLAPDLFAMIRAARERGVEVGFNTNATLLTRAKSEQLVALGVSWLHVSVDGATARTFEHVRDGGHFERVVRNLRTLLEVKRERRAELPRVQLNAVALRSNLRELPDIVRLAASLDVARCWVQNLSHDFSDTDHGTGYDEIRRFVADEAVPDDSEALQEARRVADALGVELRLPGGETEQGRDGDSPGCDWPWARAYVTYDGRMQPCCMVMGADRAVLGDVSSASVSDNWHGDAYVAFRRQLRTAEPPDVCRGCSLYKHRF